MDNLRRLFRRLGKMNTPEPSQEALLAQVRRLVSAGSAAEVKTVLRDHPALLDGVTDARLTATIHTENAAEIDAVQYETNCQCLAARRFLEDCRVTGADAALRETGLPVQEAFPLAELIELVQAEENPQRRAELAARSLACLRKDSEPSWWAEMQYLMACGLYKAEPFSQHALRQAAQAGELALQTWQKVSNQTNWEETLHLLDEVWRRYGPMHPPDTMQRALDFFDQQLGQPHVQRRPVEKARLLISLAGLHCQTPGEERPEKIEEGIRVYNEAMDLLKGMQPTTGTEKDEQRKNMAIISTNIGHAYLSRAPGPELDNIQAAIAHYQDALKVFSEQYQPERWAEAEFGMAAACRRRGNLPVDQPDAVSWLRQGIEHAEHAEKVFEAAKPQAETLYTPEERRYHWARAQFMLATLHGQADGPQTPRSAGNLHKAIAYYQNALDVFDPQKQRFDWGQAQNSLGNAYADLAGFEDAWNNLNRAIDCYDKALSVRKAESEPQYYAETHNNLGTVYTDRWLRSGDSADMEQADEHYREALVVRQPETLPLGARQSGLNRGHLHLMARVWDTALEGFEIALAGARLVYEASTTQVSKKAELQQNAALHRQTAYAAAMLGRASYGLFLLEQGKTRLLHEQMQVGAVRPAKLKDDALWERRQRAAERLLGARSIDEESEQFKNLRGEQISARAAWAAQLEQANREIRAIDADFLSELAEEHLASVVTDVRAALIAFCVTEIGSVGFILTGGTGEVRHVDVPGFTLQRLNALIFPGVEDSNSESWIGAYRKKTGKDLEACWTEVLDNLSGELVQPVIDALPDDIERLVILPGGGLFLIPFHAMQVKTRGHAVSRLGDCYTIRYTPSIKLMVRRQQPAWQPQPARMVALLNPHEAPPDQDALESLRMGHLPYASLMSLALEKLSGQRASPEIKRGAECNFATLAALAPEAGILHFYTHGAFDWQQPAKSGLMLAGNDVLTLEHLQTGQVSLSSCRLVTLTACETGIPETERLPEEYTSLPAGFMQAGARCVISSLWKVQEAPTALLMSFFYERHLAGLDAARALAEAQAYLRSLTYRDLAAHPLIHDAAFVHNDPAVQALLFKYSNIANGNGTEDPCVHPFEHPYYWAAFTVMGDG
jgi:CHAT domain-containing protein/tetratricopeptide (TPR) repeat protein